MAESQEFPVATSTKPSPKLSPSEFSLYNSMADHMELFHNHFRQTWTAIYSSACMGKRPSAMSIRQFLNMGLDFCQKLHMHHTIEERHIFPVLAKKMPAFREELDLLTQHKQIHQGLDHFQAYLEQCSTGERELRLTELKDLMDTFGDILWTHLSEEVEQLGAENMRKYWTFDQMRAMPM